MGVLSISQFLVLFTWFPLALLMFFLMLIARFYQRFSARRTYYWLYLVPIVCYGAAAVRYASIDQVTGDLIGDTFGGIAAMTLAVLSLLLYRRMMSGVDRT